MKVNWKKLSKYIPHRIKLSSRDEYEIVWIDEFLDGKTLGETRFEERQIVIKNGQTPKESYSTFIHEWFHAISHAYEINLTESQVQKLEKAFIYNKMKGNI